jgi:hypothetical protein
MLGALLYCLSFFHSDIHTWLLDDAYSENTHTSTEDTCIVIVARYTSESVVF